MMTADTAVEVAHRIAIRIARTALWNDGACTWPIQTPDRSAPLGSRRVKQDLAGAYVYSGTAGIALFLSEAFRQTQDRELLDTAAGALEYARRSARLPNYAFHTGPIGLAYALARFAEVSGRNDCASVALAELERLAGNEDDDRGIDVIGGAAGAIPPLLHLAHTLSDPLPLRIAVALGEKLLRSAARGARGWSWGSSASVAQNLTGYAHGNAGIAHGLAELFNATGDSRYKYGAEQAVAYERSWFSEDAQNWPDFRHLDLTELIAREGTMSLEARGGAFSDVAYYRPTFMSAWCHGATGIGLSRLRLAELLGDDSYIQEAATALATVYRTVTGSSWQRASFALCHGTSSDCEMLLAGARVLGNLEARNLAMNVAEAAAEHFEMRGRAWPSGGLGGGSDPTLMLGDAGIGYMYLRMAQPETASVTVVEGFPTRSTAHSSEPDSGTTVQRPYIDSYFGAILRVLDRIFPNSVLAWPKPRSGDSDLAQAHAAIQSRIDAIDDEDIKAKLRDAFQVEHLRYVLSLRLPHRCDALIDQRREALTPASYTERCFALAAGLHLVNLRWDWDLWLAKGSASLSDIAEDVGQPVAVWATANGVRVQRLSPLAAALLDHVSGISIATAETALSAVAEFLGSEADPESIKALGLGQMASLCQGGLLVTVPGRSSASFAKSEGGSFGSR